MMLGAVIGRGLGTLALLILTWKVLARGLSPLPAGFLLGILDNANLIFHEAGHILLTPFRMKSDRQAC